MAIRTVTALFDDYSDAAEAVRKIEAAGVSHDMISIVSNDSATRSAYSDKPYSSDYSATTRKVDDDHNGGVGSGATLGTVLGGGAGLLAGLGALAIPGLGPVVAAGWLASTLVGAGVGAGIGAAAGGLADALTDEGIPAEDAHSYAEGVRRGGTLVTVRTEEAMVDRVVDILDDEGTVDMDERETTWRGEGWTGYAPTVGATTTGTTGYGTTAGGIGSAISGAAKSVGDALTPDRDTTFGSTTDRSYAAGTTSTRDEAIPVVEEELRVGKREVNRGRVRVHSRVIETPVQEQVRLRDEHVHVERVDVNRPVAPGDALFQERTIEAVEHDEEAVVSKEARVTGEVRLTKTAEERVETVADTVRRTEVEVDDETGLSTDRDRKLSGL